MMKRMTACLLAIVCLLTAFAFAEGERIGDMKVIKVKQSVNLRKGPSTDTASIGQVPLGAIVTDCTKVEGSEWIAVNYNGVAGYIRGDFLQAVETPEVKEEESSKKDESSKKKKKDKSSEEQKSEGLVAEGTPLVPGVEQEQKKAKPVLVEVEEAPVADINQKTEYDDDYVILDVTVGGVRVMARQIFEAADEYLMAVGLDGKGKEIWKKETVTDAITELTQTDAFMAGTQNAPLLLMYNACRGLTAIDPATGEVAWELAKKDLDLGGSISRGVDANGIAYIGGYYGPDPVAIDAAGNVLWQASSGNENATWLYNLELRNDGIACYYSNMAGGDSGCIVYDYNGMLKEVVYD